MAAILYYCGLGDPWELTKNAFERLDRDSQLEVLADLKQKTNELLESVMGWYRWPW